MADAWAARSSHKSISSWSKCFYAQEDHRHHQDWGRPARRPYLIHLFDFFALISHFFAPANHVFRPFFRHFLRIGILCFSHELLKISLIQQLKQIPFICNYTFYV
jgi:hypothetical protein